MSCRRNTAVESLESRRLLSSAVSAATTAAATGAAANPLDAIIAEPSLTLSPSASSGVAGLSPAQVKKAYGFDTVNFSGVKGDGTGQTIAIVGAYNAPNILNDLKTFDAKFGLSNPPSFKK